MFPVQMTAGAEVGRGLRRIKSRKRIPRTGLTLRDQRRFRYPRGNLENCDHHRLLVAPLNPIESSRRLSANLCT